MLFLPLPPGPHPVRDRGVLPPPSLPSVIAPPSARVLSTRLSSNTPTWTRPGYRRSRTYVARAAHTFPRILDASTTSHPRAKLQSRRGSVGDAVLRWSSNDVILLYPATSGRAQRSLRLPIESGHRISCGECERSRRGQSSFELDRCQIIQRGMTPWPVVVRQPLEQLQTRSSFDIGPRPCSHSRFRLWRNDSARAFS